MSEEHTVRVLTNYLASKPFYGKTAEANDITMVCTKDFFDMFCFQLLFASSKLLLGSSLTRRRTSFFVSSVRDVFFVVRVFKRARSRKRA
jgi:hypothetical protein